MSQLQLDSQKKQQLMGSWPSKEVWSLFLKSSLLIGNFVPTWTSCRYSLEAPYVFSDNSCHLHVRSWVKLFYPTEMEPMKSRSHQMSLTWCCFGLNCISATLCIYADRRWFVMPSLHQMQGATWAYLICLCHQDNRCLRSRWSLSSYGVIIQPLPQDCYVMW